MRCLFCKADSSTSRSVEHVIPESLGNHTLVLPAGVVCDRCNNYFAIKVERPLLESGSISLLRFHDSIPSKRGRVPPAAGVLLPGYPVMLHRHPGREVSTSIGIPPEAIEGLLRGDHSELVLPLAKDPTPDHVLSRFMAKAALETVASRLIAHPDGLAYLVDDAQFDPIRNHARRGEPPEWPVNVRRIYDARTKWLDDAGNHVQLVHESDILHTDKNEFYFMLALFGLELTVNIGGPTLQGYTTWLAEHDDASPLYSGKNSDGDLRPTD